jgi:hypothetical protein
MKTKMLIFFMGVLFSVVSFAQVKIDPRLYAKYDKSYLEKISKENPQQLEKMNFFVEKAGYIIDMPGKPIQYKELVRLSDNSKDISLEEIKNFNPYLYNCKNDVSRTTYYKIGNTGKLLIMRSLQELNRMYDNYLKLKSLKN